MPSGDLRIFVGGHNALARCHGRSEGDDLDGGNALGRVLGDRRRFQTHVPHTFAPRAQASAFMRRMASRRARSSNDS